MMEKHKCKFCYRSFSNGRALGGHMRSHMMNLPIHPKPNESPPLPPPQPPTIQLSFEAESDSSPSSSSIYGLRENPKRSFIFTDPNQFIDAGSIILHQESETETETETESSKNPTRPRSKRVKKLDTAKLDTAKPNESVLSSSSDITTEEDIAFCLMLLSRDNNNNWRKQTQTQQHNYYYDDQEEQHHYYEEEQHDEDEDEDEEEAEEEMSEAESEELKPLKKVRGRYKCDTCNKVFRSYQALGGHRASHKKSKLVAESGGGGDAGDSIFEHRREKINTENANNNGEKKIHECPVCFRGFSSGQALGGHKRTHGIGTSSASATTSTATTVAATTIPAVTATNIEVARNSVKFGDSLLDLNLPAPMDDGDGDGAVSDAELVKLQ